MLSTLCYLSPVDESFPSVDKAVTDPDGLLAVGGDLCPSRLLNAYRHGIFPWFNAGEPILWWSPSQRGILEFNNFRINRTFAKFLRKKTYTLTVNTQFERVIDHCRTVVRADQQTDSQQPEQSTTWITDDMRNAYSLLHKLGYAHSIEVWWDKQLVGGLYGVVVGAVFCGESMFHLKSHASKVAYMGLVQWFRQHGGHFIDCQMQNDFLATMGVTEWPRKLYLEKLNDGLKVELPKAMWQPQTIEINL